MVIIWDEARIRVVMEELDEKTGLSGAKLPITFGNAKRTLGQFNISEMTFRFSNYWFQNPDWQYESAVDVIRHEYAHYMDWELNHAAGHGRSWKACCAKIGALPKRLYTDKYNNYFQALHKKEKELADAQIHYSAEKEIFHPKYGHGVIERVEGNGADTIICAAFELVGMKRILLKWIVDNCTIASNM